MGNTKRQANAAVAVATPLTTAIPAPAAINGSGPWANGAALYSAYIALGGKAGPLYATWRTFYYGQGVAPTGYSLAAK